MSAIQCYSLRRFSPYQGAVQVVAVEGIRAMSADGDRWRVQFLSQHSRYASYGVWHADGSGSLIETPRTREIIEALRNRPSFPFPIADHLELWLLDAKDRLPLAILAATLPDLSPPNVTEPRWLAGLKGDDSFFAPSLGATSAAAVQHMPHHAVISRLVQKAAGATPSAQWFLRDGDGNGSGLKGYNIDAVLAERELHKDAFPELLLRADWPAENETALVTDYHDWYAPDLLTHPNLTRATRDRLERAACRQAEKLYRVRHLLPSILNRELLDVAFVEAVIRRSA